MTKPTLIEGKLIRHSLKGGKWFYQVDLPFPYDFLKRAGVKYLAGIWSLHLTSDPHTPRQWKVRMFKNLTLFQLTLAKLSTKARLITLVSATIPQPHDN